MQPRNNYRHISFFLTVVSIISLFCNISCKTSPKKENSIPEPQWITDKKGAFPDSEYISQLGTGTTAKEAENNSIAQLASYFNTNVKSFIEGETFTYNNTNDEGIVARTIKSSVVTSTDLELFALETEEPYYLVREKKWYCCAHINRKTAWNQYEPIVRDQKNAFYSVYNLAQAQEEPLEKIKMYKKAQYEGEMLSAFMYKAYMFSKPLTDSAFAKDKAVAASIPGLIQNEKNKCVFAVDVSNDFGQTVSSSITKAFSQMGFPVVTKNENSIYTVQALVNYNEIDEDDLMVYYPSIKVVVKTKDKSLYVYEGKTERILSYNESKAKKSACTELAGLIERELESDFKSTIGLSE
ncbi:MAG: hypothetical protein J5527_10895 [Treponema sp.]|nr:hypothetical protein [Treponema sp.]